MHWDPSIGWGNILTIVVLMGTIAIAFNKFINDQKTSIAELRNDMAATAQAQAASLTTVSNATNNLASITERLQKAVELQNGRLHTVETQLAVAQAVATALEKEHVAKEKFGG